MKNYLFILPLIFFMGCWWAKPCQSPDGPALQLSSYIGVKWGCEDQKVVDEAIMAFFSSKGWCTKESIQKQMASYGKQGLIGSFICPVIAQAAKNQIVTWVDMPKKAKCKEELIGKDFAGALDLMCQAVFPI